MISGRKLAIAFVTALGLAALAAPQAASPIGIDEGKQKVKMTWRVKKLNVARNEDGQQDILKGSGNPFGRVTINMQTPEADIGSEEKLVSFVLFPWRGHRGRDVAGEIPVKNTIVAATTEWQTERVQLLNGRDGEFEQQDPGHRTRYLGRITKFSGVLTCYYATATCTGEIAVRGWFQPLVKD